MLLCGRCRQPAGAGCQALPAGYSSGTGAILAHTGGTHSRPPRAPTHHKCHVHLRIGVGVAAQGHRIAPPPVHLAAQGTFYIGSEQADRYLQQRPGQQFGEVDGPAVRRLSGWRACSQPTPQHPAHMVWVAACSAQAAHKPLRQGMDGESKRAQLASQVDGGASGSTHMGASRMRRSFWGSCSAAHAMPSRRAHLGSRLHQRPPYH